MKKKLSDMVFQQAQPPDHKSSLTVEDLSRVLVKRLGLKRKESRSSHEKLLLELLKYRKDNLPMTIDQISSILKVSQSQTYEEIRKWRSLGLVEFVKIPMGQGFTKGYILTANTVNRLMDRVESSIKAFMRQTRRISKDFDDLLMLESARRDLRTKEDTKKEQETDENGDEPEDDGDINDDSEEKENN
jgi:predicted transcriptional regulator